MNYFESVKFYMWTVSIEAAKSITDPQAIKA